jgi:lactonase
VIALARGVPLSLLVGVAVMGPVIGPVRHPQPPGRRLHLLQNSGRRGLLSAAALAARAAAAGALAQDSGATALAYDAETRRPVPIPPSERGLQTVVAELWFKVSDEGLVLEGPAFDVTGTCSFVTFQAGACFA